MPIFVKAQETEVGQGQSLSKLPHFTCVTHMWVCQILNMPLLLPPFLSPHTWLLWFCILWLPLDRFAFWPSDLWRKVRISLATWQTLESFGTHCLHTYLNHLFVVMPLRKQDPGTVLHSIHIIEHSVGAFTIPLMCGLHSTSKWIIWKMLTRQSWYFRNLMEPRK